MFKKTNMNKIILSLIFFVCIFSGVYAQNNSGVTWYPIEMAESLQKEMPRKIVVFVCTDWNGWCPTMEKRTFAVPSVNQIMNNDVYAVKLKGDDRKTITFNGRTYTYNRDTKCNDLASYLLNGSITYPSTVILDEDLKVLAVVGEYLNPMEFRLMLSYYVSDSYKTMTPDEYFQKQQEIAGQGN
jgi:thioredoxin-related protein